MPNIAIKHKNSFGHQPQQAAKTNRQPQFLARLQKTGPDTEAVHGKPRAKVLKDSLRLQQRLRQLTHQVLVAQEDEREKLSHELRDEIAQTLLAINVHLLLLRQTARNKTRGLTNQIASAQRLVVKSAKLVRRFAHALENHRPTLNERTVATV